MQHEPSILTPEEMSVFDALVSENEGSSEGLPAGVGLIMRTTTACNLNCAYCYVSTDASTRCMTFPILVRAIRDLTRGSKVRRMRLYWFGGEPTLMPVRYYEVALWVEKRLRRHGQIIGNTVITNGTRITDEWVAFWSRNRFEVHVSLDGPPEVHDTCRRFGDRRPSAHVVLDGIKKLQLAGIHPSVDAVVTPELLQAGAKSLLEFVINLRVPELRVRQLLPNPGDELRVGHAPLVDFRDYVEFLRDLFREWWPDKHRCLVIQQLTDLVERVQGRRGNLCRHSGSCYGAVYTVEPDGDVYTCDDFLGVPSHNFGNLRQMTLSELARSEKMRLLREQQTEQQDAMRECECFSICHGGCPRWRSADRTRERCCGLKHLINDIQNAFRVTKDRSSVGYLPNNVI